ncbi:MAG: GspH/FimT family pseudopilin [Pseudoxanthomonas sp.]
MNTGTCQPAARPARRLPRRDRGFTLVELMAVVGVATLGIAIGLPSFASLLRRERDTLVANQLASYMASARSTAVTYRKRTAVCPYDGLGGCRDGSDWSGGWIMFYDTDGDRQPDDPTDIMRIEHPPNDPELRIVSSSGRPQIGFLPSGTTNGSNLTLRICRNGILRKAVIVSLVGRTRVEDAASRPCME